MEPIEVRLARLEERIQVVQEDVASLRENFESFREFCVSRWAENPGMSRRDRASIVIALITSVSAIIITLINALV